jgi:dihydroflavonol-4-reductase
VTVLVTGSTGVVGGAVLRHLLSSGLPVRALVRPGSDLPAGVEVAVGDLLDYPSLLAAAGGCEMVFHLAGANRMCDPHPESIYQVNVEGTRNVVRACRAAGVRRLIYTSSAATIGEPSGSVGNEETVHRGRFLSHYERSKYQAERVVTIEAADLDYVILNPSSVQGPGRATGTGRLILDAVDGRLPFLVDVPVSIVDIDDCARGHLLAATRGEGGRRYLLNSFSLSMREAIAILEGVVGRPLRIRFLPGPLLMAAAIGTYPVRLLRRPFPLCLEMARTLLHGHVYDGGRATRELGLTYTSAAATLESLIGWAAAQGLLRRPPRGP